MVKKNSLIGNIKFTKYLLLSMFLLGCIKSGNSEKEFINATISENVDNWKKSENIVIDTVDTKVMDLYFLNNPYNFESSENMILYINDDTKIYIGAFKKYVNVRIPRVLLNNRILPTLQIFKKNMTYSFMNKITNFISENDTVLYIVFCPENDRATGCYLFSQREKIL